MARTFSTMLNRSGEWASLFQILVGRLLLLLPRYYISCGFVINSFYYVEICSLWASLVAQLVKNLPAMQETPV